VGLFFCEIHDLGLKINGKHHLDFQIQKKFWNKLTFQTRINEKFSTVIHCFILLGSARENLHQSSRSRSFLCNSFKHTYNHRNSPHCIRFRNQSQQSIQKLRGIFVKNSTCVHAAQISTSRMQVWGNHNQIHYKLFFHNHTESR